MVILNFIATTNTKLEWRISVKKIKFQIIFWSYFTESFVAQREENNTNLLEMAQHDKIGTVVVKLAKG